MRKLDAAEVFGLVFIVGGMFTLMVINALHNHESPVIRQPKTDLQMMPARGYCTPLTGDAYVECMVGGVGQKP